jgi:hypothetical protein
MLHAIVTLCEHCSASSLHMLRCIKDNRALLSTAVTACNARIINSYWQLQYESQTLQRVFCICVLCCITAAECD